MAVTLTPPAQPTPPRPPRPPSAGPGSAEAVAGPGRHSADAEAAVTERRKIVKRLGIVLLALVVALVGFVAYMLVSLNGRFGGTNVDPMLGTDRPTDVASTSGIQTAGDPYSGRAMNILVLGSDSRSGDNSTLSGDAAAGARSDTILIAHVSADRRRVDVVSIPRDTMVVIPQCYYDDNKTKVQNTGGSGLQMINAALSWGTDLGHGKPGTTAAGVACMIKTIERATKIRINGYVLVDFAGFANIVDAIGGVDMWMPCAVSSVDAGNLVLPAGLNHLDGSTALNYARARHGSGVGDGSDLMRIKRQQALFMALAQKVLHMDMATNIGKLYNFIGSVGDSMTTDLGNGLDLAGFAYSLRNLSPGSMTFSTVPVVGYPDDLNRVIIAQSRAQPVFNALAYDLPIPGTHPDSAQPTTAPDEAPPTTSTNPTSTPTTPGTTGPATTPPTTPGTTLPHTSTPPSTVRSTPASTKTPPALPPGVVSAPMGQC